MVLEMDFFPGQVVQWKTYEQTEIPCGKTGNRICTKVHTGIVLGCITESSETFHTDKMAMKDIYPIVIAIQKDQSYEESCTWLVQKLLRANREKHSTYSLVELGGARHYAKEGKTLATMARARLVEADDLQGDQSGWTTTDELELLWQIQSGVYTDTADSAEKTADLSKGIRVLPAFEIHADREKILANVQFGAQV